MRPILEKNQPVHIISRAVEGKNIFNEEMDCLRFIFQIYATNFGRPVMNICRQDMIKIVQTIFNGEEISSKFIVKEHFPLVHILAFALVINHSHFYLVPNIENGVTLFMKKLNIGFAKYFNLKHKRKGALFGSRYGAVSVKDQRQSDAVGRYVSIINPLDVFQPNWRENGLNNKEEAFEFLKKYQFSSFPDKIGERRSKIIAPQEVLDNYLTISSENTDGYKEFVESFLEERFDSRSSLFLE
jgi:putative transposase